MGGSAWVVPGNPDASPLLSYLTEFSGPMFKVFDDDDLAIWRRWIASLKSFENQGESRVLDSYGAMRHLVSRVMKTAMAEPAHHFHLLWGPTPNAHIFPNLSLLPHHGLVQQSVATWLSLPDPDWMLKALIQPLNRLIVCGSPSSSAFLQTALAPGTKMGTSYARPAADTGGQLRDKKHTSPIWSWRDIVERWIEDDCPLKSDPNKTFDLFPPPGFPQDDAAQVLALMRKAKPVQKGRHFIH